MLEPAELMNTTRPKIAKMNASKISVKKTTLIELVSFFKRLTRYEIESQKSNPTVR